MSEIDNLLNDIEKLRKNLYKIFEDKEENMQDPEVIKASQTLNKAITKYNDFIKKKLEK